MGELRSAQTLADRDARIFRLEDFIAKFLRYGVLFSGLLIFIGWMMQIDFHHNVFAGFEHYHHVRLIDLLSAFMTQHAWGPLIAYMGLMALISLPLIRVALVAAVFLSQRDFALAACAFLVLFGLALSFALGFEI